MPAPEPVPYPRTKHPLPDAGLGAGLDWLIERYLARKEREAAETQDPA